MAPHLRRLAGGAAAAVALLAISAGSAGAHPWRPPGHGSAVFVQTDNASGNAIVAYDRAGDGTLVRSGIYPTGGDGGQLDGSVVDHTASEGALTYDAGSHELYAVNAGSNSVTAFHVDGDQLTRRTVIADVGDFPVSVAVRGGLVYVLSARNGGAIEGFRQVGPFFTRVPFSTRALGLDPAQTPEFTSTPGEVTFSPNGRQLVVTTKNGANSIDVFNLGPLGMPAARPAVTTLAGAAPFGVSFDAAGQLTVAEAGPNAVARFALSPTGQLSSTGSVATGQMATCWIIAVGDELYASNAGSGTLSEVADAPGQALSLTGSAAAGDGTVDATATPDGRFVYAQSGATGTLTAFKVGADGTLTRVGSYTVPGAVGGEGVVAP
jgi:6-phosphogluconolactonase (cycloisomerase 2 family)